MKGYEIIDDIISDVMFKAYGKTLEELVENSGEALFSVVCDIGNVEEKKSIIVEVEGEDEEGLIHNWLSELLTRIDTENMFFSKFKVLQLVKNNGFKLRVECYGEEIRTELVLTVAKAVTYYRYSVEKTRDGWIATVVLDV